MGNHPTATRQRVSRWPWAIAPIVAVAGTILSFSLMRAQMAMEQRSIESSFSAEARRMNNSIAQEVNLFLDVLDSVRELHAISDQVGADDFNEFVDKGMAYQRQILGGFGFAQRMSHFTRQMIELVDDKQPEPSLRILEQNGDGSFIPAAPRSEYCPLTYQTPANVLGIPVGFDFNSVPEHRAAIETMRLSGKPVVGGRVPGQTQECYYLFSPILYETIEGVSMQAPGYMIGFAVAAFEPRAILARAVGDAPLKSLDTRIAPSSGGVHISASGSPESSPLQFEGVIRVADQQWGLRCQADESYIRTRRTKQPVVILSTGLLITGLLTLEFLLMAGRARRIEKLVQARTTALREAKSQLEREMTERARLENEILEIGNREKARIGQDLHDSLGQKLTGAVFLSRALAGKMESSPPTERDEVRRINEILKEALTQVRRLAQGLAPVELGSEGIAVALKRLAADTEETYGIACVFQSRIQGATPAGKTAMHLYHIAQEAVSNAVRHGKAAEITITLSIDATRGELSIEDNGAGLPEDAHQRGGMGLQIMQHRAVMIGGTLDVRPRLSGGTAIVCRYGM